ncbi:hypothetical protein [Leucobacter sp. USHLN153]|uniref:hypothetical protein n=1 Tax=Leucobacter sp. USHLN153 TaxID=3081268 RepID=UPI0030174672
MLLVTLLLATGTSLFAPAAEAIPRGEVVTFAGGVEISNYVLPNGKRAYCVEISMGEPSGVISEAGRLNYLLGRAGMFPQFEETSGIRQMNYLIDEYGQSGDAWDAAAVQLTIWRMRERFRPGNATLDRVVSLLEGSSKGVKLLTDSDKLYDDARKNATAPTKPKAITTPLTLAPVGSETSGRFRVSYPAGTSSLSLVGGTFEANGEKTARIADSAAGDLLIRAQEGAESLQVSGSWSVKGKRGWEALLDIYNTSTSAGGVGQRVAVATGSSQHSALTGRFAVVKHELPPPLAPPAASSRAQASAIIGGAVSDSLIVEEVEGTRIDMWRDASVTFTAYLEPEAGEIKFDEHWDPILGEPYEAQAENPETGELLWSEWWANADGSPITDAAGVPIPSRDANGVATSGTTSDGRAYPVQLLNDDGTPRVDAAGAPVYAQGREPVMERRQDPLRWSAEEVEPMSKQERCLAQPVFESSKIEVTKPGTVSSGTTVVKSAGTLHWVERVSSGETVVHEGKCGVANETTKIGQPAVETRALSSAVLGDELYDVAIVSGELSPEAEYSLVFEAYRAPEHTPERAHEDVLHISPIYEPAPEPRCTPENIVFRSQAVPVEGTGEVRSPGFVATPSHGEKVWWVETLRLETPQGPRVIHRGACGLDTETTIVERPLVETQATESVPVGGEFTDTALVSGGIAENAGARWELTFAGYLADTEPIDAPKEDAAAGAMEATAAVCRDENQLFETEAVPVTGPGSVASPAAIAEPEWAGRVWWVETLWLIQGESRTPMHVGECGLDHETTFVTTPDVTTQAASFVTIGDVMSDTAEVTGSLTDRQGTEHRIVFRGYRGDATLTGTDNATCTDENLLFTTEPVVVSAAGEVVSPEVRALPEYGETIWWVETLSLWEGTTERRLHTGDCGLPEETTTLQRPTVRTESAGSVELGEQMYDTAIVDGAFPEAEDVEFRVRFAAFRRDADGRETCAPEDELRDLSDAEGTRVPGPGSYESRKVTTTPEHLGIGGFVETLVMIADGEEHPVASGKCGEPSERFEVRAVGASPLAHTGAPDLGLWLWGGVGAGALGTLVFAISLKVRRRTNGVVRDCLDMR